MEEPVYQKKNKGENFSSIKFIIFKYIVLIMLLLSSQCFSPLYPLSALHLPALQHSPSLSSCPWVVRISSLASLFPIPFLTSPCLFYAYQLCFLFLVPSPSPRSSPPLPHWKPFMRSPFLWFFPVIVVCLVFVFVF